MREEELYQPIKEFFEKQGYKVHSEVNYCDVTAVKDEELVIVELKKFLSVELILQGALRQKLTRNVYIAVPKLKKLMKQGSIDNIVYLLRRLELGLLVVDTNYKRVEVVTQPKVFDMEKSRRGNRRKVTNLINEIDRRSMDLNTGGSWNKKLVTAYREQVIKVACILKMYGEQYPREITAKGGDPKKTQGILRNNYYNWFINKGGKYDLTEQGIKELENYPELTEVFFKKISEENKILYVSDLDGTLLNSAVRVSGNTEDILNKLIEEGTLFTVATARSPETVADLLKNININIPIVSMNGVFIYDLKNREYIQINCISNPKANELIKVLESFEKNFFMYTFNEERELITYYKKVEGAGETAFLEERLGNNRKYIQIDNYKKMVKNNVIYFTMLDSYEILSEIYGEISLIKGISSVLYKDNYSEDWLLEVFSSKASKKAGVEFVAEHISSKYTIAFGDNLNDMEFMQAANRSCAVSNAVEAVLKIASDVILSNNEDGVAKFIQDNEYCS